MTEILKLCDSENFTKIGVSTPKPPPLCASRLPGLEREIISAARRWLGTPFRHQGRLKGVACDCLGLLIGVAKELELRDRQGNPLAALDEGGYGHFPDSDYLQQKLAEALQPVKETTPGSIGLFRIDGRAQHLGIFTDDGLIHAYAPARKVVEHRLSKEWQEKVVAVFKVGNARP